MFRRAWKRIATLSVLVLIAGLAAAQTSLPETAMGPEIDREQGYLVEEIADQPITHVIYSHSHGDHIGAAGQIFPEDVTIIAQAATALMFVDVVFPGWVPFKFLALAKDVPGFVDVHDEILEYDFDTFVGGHLTRLGTRADVEVARDYVHDVFDNCLAALQSVDFMAIAQEVGFQNQWALFEAYLDAVAQHCADATLETWAGELGDAEVFTFSHCWTMMEAIRVDWNMVGGATPTLD